MAFKCPKCSTDDGLRITQRIELPPDIRSDEIILQVVICSLCGFRAAAVYEESRRGALGSESWSHVGYRLGDETINNLEEKIKNCPQPSNRHCSCPTHRSFGRTDRSGRWTGLPELDAEISFPMQLTS